MERLAMYGSPKQSPRKMSSPRGGRKGSVDSVESVDVAELERHVIKSAAPSKGGRIRYLQATETNPAGPRKATPRPSPAARASVDAEEKKSDRSEDSDPTLSQKNRLEVTGKLIGSCSNVMSKCSVVYLCFAFIAGNLYEVHFCNLNEGGV